jgi:apolipoprotein N-acyltransferase
VTPPAGRGGPRAAAALSRLERLVRSDPPRARRWGLPVLALLAGLLSGSASPGGVGLGAWAVMYVPFFLALDLLLRGGAPRRAVRTWATVFLLSWLVGLGHAVVNGPWVVNTAHVYGHLPLPLAHGVNLLGFGTLVGLEAFGFLAVPFLLGWGWPRWGFVLVVLWSTAFQTVTPRFFYWTYGQLMYPVPALVQIADVVGSGGLNLLMFPLHLLLFAGLRELYAPGSAGRRELAVSAAGVAVLFMAAAGYGMWRTEGLARATAAGREVNLAGIQPNFSLGYLASNPALSHSQRRSSLRGLMEDTVRALDALPAVPGAPTLVVWPESVFPVPYFREPNVRRVMEAWVRERGIHLVLTSLTETFERPGDRSTRKVFGSSIHVSPDGAPVEVYNKIALIPFGETIPFGEWFPAYRRALRAWIPQIAEFERGREFTVFHLSPEVRLAPMICFDAVRQPVAIGMRRNGANLGLVLANLAWFGRTNVSDLFAFFVRFRAIETRLPYLMLSQNGESVVIDAAGRAASPRLGQFETGALTLPVKVPKTFSFYAAHVNEVYATYLILLAALLAWRAFPLLRGRLAAARGERD